MKFRSIIALHCTMWICETSEIATFDNYKRLIIFPRFTNAFYTAILITYARARIFCTCLCVYSIFERGFSSTVTLSAQPHARNCEQTLLSPYVRITAIVFYIILDRIIGTTESSTCNTYIPTLCAVTEGDTRYEYYTYVSCTMYVSLNVKNARL